MLGTAAYLAPEQARGEEAGPAADLYALGVVTYQLLAGRLPYEAGSLTELALKQQREHAPLLDEVVEGVRTRSRSRSTGRSRSIPGSATPTRWRWRSRSPTAPADPARCAGPDRRAR